MKNSFSISIILPTYNEKENVLLLIEAIHNELMSYNHEIIIVDDDSPDGTYQAILNLNLPYARAILRTKNRGLANSIRSGIENSKGNILVLMDSDFNHQPHYLPFMIQALSHYDCVSASRFLYGGKMGGRLRHLFSWVFNIFVRITTAGQITDSLYGYLAIKKKILYECNFDKIFWGYGDYCIRLMYYLQKNRAGVLQFPAVNGKRKQGKGNSNFFKVLLQYTKEVFKLAYKERFGKNAEKY
jgi:dolichol-phosphate mannosyltransferase